MDDIRLHFEGPFTFTAGDRSLFQSSLADAACIYLWTIKSEIDGNYWIHYVGETTRFAWRQREHLINVLGLNYGIFDPVRARQGVLEAIWPGLWRDRTHSGPTRLLEALPQIALNIQAYVASLEVFVATVDMDTRVRRHIEGSIGWNLRKRHPDACALYPADNRIGTSAVPLSCNLIISSVCAIAGLDEVIAV